LNLALGLADCPLQSKALPVIQAVGCLRAETASCLGPCRGNCSTAEYQVAVRRAVAFLEGIDNSLAEEAQRRMTTAAERRDYATAARLRDRWRLIESLGELLRRFREPGSHSLVYPVRLGRQEHWLAIRQSMAVSGCRAPDSPESARQAEALVATFDSPRVASAGDIGYQQIANRWFADHPEERAAGLSLEEARRECDRHLLGAPRPR
jgi:excinuclease ABC subunit C